MLPQQAPARPARAPLAVRRSPKHLFFSSLKFPNVQCSSTVAILLKKGSITLGLQGLIGSASGYPGMGLEHSGPSAISQNGASQHKQLVPGDRGNSPRPARPASPFTSYPDWQPDLQLASALLALVLAPEPTKYPFSMCQRQGKKRTFRIIWICNDLTVSGVVC